MPLSMRSVSSAHPLKILACSICFQKVPFSRPCLRSEAYVSRSSMVVRSRGSISFPRTWRRKWARDSCWSPRWASFRGLQRMRKTMVNQVLLSTNGSLRRIGVRGSVEEHVKGRSLSQLVRQVLKRVWSFVRRSTTAADAELAVILSGAGQERHVTIARLANYGH